MDGSLFNLKEMNIIGSPDISVLAVKATFDLSGPLPLVSLVNLSQGSNLDGCSWWFALMSPTGSPIHEGSLANPDANGAWTAFAISNSWPRPYNQIEWSGAPYNLTVYVQDSQGNQYNDSNYNAAICRPFGNTQSSKTYFGASSTDVKVMCDQARVFFQNTTNPSYKGLSGTQISSSLKMVYPVDEIGYIPAPFSISNFSTAAVPISYGSDNYQFRSEIVYEYELDENVFVRIKYQSLSPKSGASFVRFSVYCNIDLLPLICEFEKLVDSIEKGTCVSADDAIRKLNLINPKFALLAIGIFQPLTGVNVPELIEEIQQIGGFSCDCFTAPTGIIPQTSSTIDGYTFSIIPVCGDITGTVTVSGTNIQFNLQDKNYVFALKSNISTTAFSITPAVNGCTKTYTFDVNMVQFATDILNTIKSNADLVNLFNSIVTGGGGGLMLSVDGKCVFQSTSAFNYTFTLSNIPTGTTSALLTSVMNASSSIQINQAFNLTNLTQLQTYLNSLGIGSFVVSNPSGQTVQISSTNNPNNLSQFQYSISSTTFTATQSSNSSGYVPLSASQVVQNIINYLCGITDGQMITSVAYSISYISTNGTEQEIIIPTGTKLSDFFTTLLNLQNQTIGNIGSSLSVSCEAIQDNFEATNDPYSTNDYVLMSRNGKCAQGNLLDIFGFMLSVGKSNATIKLLFCDFVQACGAGLSCAPYDYFDVLVTTYNSACAPIVGIDYDLS